MEKHVVTKEVLADGFNLYLDGKLWITQFGQYSKPMDSTKTIEENAQLMLDEKIAMFNAPPPKPYTQGQYDAVVESQIKEGVL